MKNIMLVCNEGMSTSFLTRKMIDVAEQKGIEAKIWAVPEATLEREWQNADVILLGPQITYLKNTIIDRVENKVPVEAISPMDYGRINAEAVLNQALKLIND